MEKINSLYEFASALSNETKWHGDHNENERSLILKAGPLSMVYENGNLRYISKGNYELIRMIYPAVRDKDWLTVEPVISDEEFDISSSSFRIRYCCHYISGDIDFFARYKIEGDPASSVCFSFEGEALNSFLKNRIGFCVLHPAEGYSGNSCTITHSNDASETQLFPRFISPNQPFTDIKSMKWKIHEQECTLDFYGDIFETEDQRNWSDASYKTYSTPLNRPFPEMIHKGEKISQKIKFKVAGGLIQEKEKTRIIKITVSRDIIFSLPAIGISRSSRKEPLTEREISIFSKMRFDHYRVDLYLFEPDWEAKAKIAISESVKLKYPAEFALFFDENAIKQSAEIIKLLLAGHPDIDSIIIYDKSAKSTPDLLTDAVAPLFKAALPGVKVGSGTNANFAQLNRNRPGSAHNDFICYAIHPQEHASDNRTFTENLQAQEYTVKSAVGFANGKAIRISPVNIQRRFNANVCNFEQPCSEKEISPQVDSRLMSLFGACWTAGSLKFLSEAGANSITYYETTGERGITQGNKPSRWPGEFRSFKGMIYPVCFVFRYLLKYKSYRLLKCKSSDSLAVIGLILYNDSEVKIILSNFTPSKQLVDIEGCSGEITIKQLNSETFADAVCDINWIENTKPSELKPGDHLLLNPFSVSFIDGCFNL